ncbi:hypothetical protein [Amycolatopsis echigonensis]|nr:hypothetical protein [Amycolatopsis echigonensis]
MPTTCLNLRAGDVQRDRIVAIILDGIRSRDAAALSGKPPA